MPAIGSFRALAHAFTVEAADPVLGHHVEEVLASLRAVAANRAEEGERLVFRRLDDPGLLANGQLVAGSTAPDRLLPSLLGHLNRQAVTSVADRCLVLHAGAVAFGSSAVLLPAPAESGKTTLTAGLVRRGLDYITDEAVAIDPSSLEVLVYAKPLSVDGGSWEVLPELEPVVSDRLRPLHSFQWQVPPDKIRRASVAGACRPSVIVFPHYERSARTAMAGMSRADAVVELAGNSFNFRDRGRDLLPVVAAVVAGCDCYRLTVGDLTTACDEILAIAGRRVRVPA